MNNSASPALPASLFAELVDVLRLAQRALNTAPRFRVDDTDSYRIAARLDAVMARAECCEIDADAAERVPQLVEALSAYINYFDDDYGPEAAEIRVNARMLIGE